MNDKIEKSGYVDGWIKETLTNEERQPCEVWTRVMGYFRPVSFYNKGKKSEYEERKCFSEKVAVSTIDTAAAE